ncbi:MAG TPA: FkbM family methyltransferase [Tepidisphaeraceae bacterium]|nr:FkbM family methyltransferase [Tepidisphaeraceae bacterium]
MTSASQVAFRLAYHAAWALGLPIGGLRPRRIYDWLGRRAYPQAVWRWHRNRWGHELRLSPSFHIDRNILLFGTYDLVLHLALERLIRPGMVCMDVGANLGEMALHMAGRVGPSGRVYAFEPVPSVMDRLRLHAERNQVQAILEPVPLALSDRCGEEEIAFAGADADNQGLASLVQGGRPETSHHQIIPTSTLDEFVSSRGIERLDLIKVDIQGAEMRFLAGAEQTLRRYGPELLIEISPDDLAGAGANSRDLCLRIESLGYRIHRVARDGTPGDRIDAATVDPCFAATNVYCTRKPFG